VRWNERRWNPREADGLVVRTLWGELAWQLGEAAGGKGKEAYLLVADSDAKGTSPGSKVLVDLFRKYGPVVILIDEWVAYVAIDGVDLLLDRRRREH
jgi:predicted AAA+ superfamily ATPase